MKYTLTYIINKISDQKHVEVTDQDGNCVMAVFASPDDGWPSLREKAHGRLRQLNEQIPPPEEIEI